MRYLDKVNKIQEKSHSHPQTKLLWGIYTFGDNPEKWNISDLCVNIEEIINNLCVSLCSWSVKMSPLNRSVVNK